MTLDVCDCMAGFLGGAAGVLVGHPLDTIKTWQQMTNTGVGRAMFKIVLRNDGLNGFYRGMMLPLCSAGAVNALVFGIYGNQLRSLQAKCDTKRERDRQLMWHVFVSGSLAGLAQSFVACPMELIKIKQQTYQYYFTLQEQRSFRAYVKYVTTSHGYIGLFRGLPLTICRDCLPFGIYMWTYENMMHIMKTFMVISELDLRYTEENKIRTGIQKRESMWLTVIAGSLAGVLSWALVIPFDVMKTSLQAEYKYNNTLDCVRRHYKEEGWRSMFRGGWMLMARALPVNAAIFVGYEWATRKCHRISRDYASGSGSPSYR